MAPSLSRHLLAFCLFILFFLSPFQIRADDVLEEQNLEERDAQVIAVTVYQGGNGRQTNQQWPTLRPGGGNAGNGGNGATVTVTGRRPVTVSAGGRRTTRTVTVGPVTTRPTTTRGGGGITTRPITTKPTTKADPQTSPIPGRGNSCLSTFLVIARHAADAYQGYARLQAYGIPYRVVYVGSGSVTLPALANGNQGNFGGIVVVSEVRNDDSNDGSSALKPEQWQQLYDYQVKFGVRMTRLDAYPVEEFGVTDAHTGDGCCEDTVEQLLTVTDFTGFEGVNFKKGATVSTKGLWHYPSRIIDPSIAREIARFAPSGIFKEQTTAAIINNINGREQIVFFTAWATDALVTSAYLDHVWVQWATRGLYTGIRRLNFGTQVDDVFLQTTLFQPNTVNFRLRPADLEAHVAWTRQIQGKMPRGSEYFIELGHNGNGAIENGIKNDPAGGACVPPSAIYYSSTPAEFADQEYKKPAGSGTNVWPTSPAEYSWSDACINLDPLAVWLKNPTNRDAFAHVSHTFTHQSLNGATYEDANKEIKFNIGFLDAIGFSAAKHFSGKGLIPPGITGFHNPDVLRAWSDNGLQNGVGDNSRSALLNHENEFWPLVTNQSANGFDGYQITPRWVSNIFYNCDAIDCNVAEWRSSYGVNGNAAALFEDERDVNTRSILGLHHDAYMFHQANMRVSDLPNQSTGTVSGKYSLLQFWVETVVGEVVRLVDWPLLTLKHDDLAVSFADRMARDRCNPNIAWNYSSDGSQIVGATLTTTGNRCGKPLPVTFPGPVTSNNGGRAEQIGSDPLTVWVTINGSPVTFTLRTPVKV
ncbi:hypothetical protein P152DRAFT_396947 [Eremomyces bilateralis CBS 781.70]|uniref:Extracellular serine-rich protein n=1 Tax=Eremomyces bilateralis CBS 781.70 TaxID=1392243 RepID=A0A6G1G3W5_9PEZI|nr:uncharacterized protein P152DRAFT_396947 [Eremomyces bilateralis CBS 781.70]KAF1812708.1 hypothetical protein P152DRAFT_396947 [Eremomyces bilateralis CBS 781.70]